MVVWQVYLKINCLLANRYTHLSELNLCAAMLCKLSGAVELILFFA